MFFLLLARFIVGLSVGIAFVSAFVDLNGNTQDTGDTADRAHVFLGTAALFAGLNYFWHRPAYDEESDISAGANDGDIEPIKYDATIPNSHSRTTLRNKNDLEANLSSRILSILLMSINASIGVPLILAYCSVIYTHFGLSRQVSLRLSSMYPLIQLGIILVFRRWSVRGVHFPSRAVLAIGYAICLMATFFLLITVSAKTLDTQPQFKAAACAFWFTILAVTSGIPCNAGVALMGELFPNRRELVDGIAYSRAFFWIISSIL
ncbi:hypothetical protein DdX_04162 [Ditylenchus destructor]|uniref:Major facilitator superfamily (MFS) profile domain-containing protein n=1 Tax=Ditylenchus destructor TaxID=166010 RepID=A0AAD4NA06_9BILA|nr:hypothetical protein DdX_04162 [Ditylenchus destructor]